MTANGTVQSRLKFLYGCYVADSGRFGIADIFANKVQHRVVIEGSGDFLSGTLPLTLNWNVAQKLHKEAHLYSIQKSLLLGAFFIGGKFEHENGTIERVCAPLYLYDLEIHLYEGTKSATVALDFESGRLNLDAVEGWLGKGERLGFSAPQRWDRADVHQLAAHLHHVRPSLDSAALGEFPKLVSSQDLRELRDGLELKCAAGASLMLVRRAKASRGLRNELEVLSGLSEADLSAPLLSYLGVPSASSALPTKTELPPIPAILSANQSSALKNARESTLSVVIGPPGTGKSFTLAAIALEHAARGESVLVCTRTPAALDAIEKQVRGLVDAPIGLIRAGKTKVIRDLKKQLDQWLRGVWERPEQDRNSMIQDRLQDLRLRIARLERKIELGVRTEQRWGDHLGDVGILSAWRRFWIARRLLRGSLVDLLDEYARLLDDFVDLNKDRLTHALATRLAHSLDTNRPLLQRFRRAIGARTDLRQEQLFDEIDFESLLATFPIWFATATHLSDVLPLRCNMFDVALIDEGSQCDLASMAPVAHRAKRLVIAGDPYQLRHVSFLSNREQIQIGEDAELANHVRTQFDFRTHSALDRIERQVVDQRNVCFLDEHFRSGPTLIRFSNEEFYDGQLKMMKARPDVVEGKIVLRHTDGQRNEDGINETEAEVLCTTLEGLIRRENFQGTIGLLSPFRAQVDSIESLVSSRLSLAEIEKHDIVIGTSHELQGQERDVMLLSFCLDGSSHSAAFRFLEQPDVFNVAITRARKTQHVFFSFQPDIRPAESIVRRYLLGREPEGWKPNMSIGHDRFVVELTGALEARSLTVWAMTQMAGTQFDLVVAEGAKLLGIDLLGFPGESRAWLGLERLRVVRRAGFSVTTASYFDWQQDREAVVRSIVARIPK